jgi:hypothetical protein
MSAADGPSFAPARPGSRPIISEPCPCPECVAGPGLTPPKVVHDRAKETRMLYLLHRDELSRIQQDELDGLLDWYIHR